MPIRINQASQLDFARRGWVNATRDAIAGNRPKGEKPLTMVDLDEYLKNAPDWIRPAEKKHIKDYCARRGME